MTDERNSESAIGRADVDPTFDPAPVFGDVAPAVHPGHPALRRALDHAPDRGSEPDDELRQAIRAFAHESAAPSLPSGRTGLLRRRGGDGATGLEARTRARRSRLWRNLLVAAVLVVIVATVTWHREPGPAGGRPAATAPEATVAPIAPSASAATGSTPVATANAPASAATGAPATAPPKLSDAEKILLAPRVTSSSTPPAPVSAAASASASPNVAKVAVPSTPPPSPPRTPAPASPSAAAPVPGTMSGSTAGAAKPTVETPPPSGPPTFAALSQWTQLTMTRADGSTRRRSKADVRELGALLSSAALAGASAEPVKGRVDWRVNLERNGQTLAKVELAGDQVRWVESNAAPGTGTPPAGALDSVREMLENVFEEPAPAAASRPVPVPVEVRNR